MLGSLVPFPLGFEPPVEAGAAPAPTGLTYALAAGPQVNLAWDASGIMGETEFSIERRDATLGEAFAELDTAVAGSEAYEGDAGPFTEKHKYQYRVVVVGGASDGLMSNVVTVFGGGVGYIRRRRRESSVR
jgi:hypothetical protein